jgi:hypothetical protein
VFSRQVAEPEKDAFMQEMRVCNDNFFVFLRPGAYLAERFPMLARLPYVVNPWKRMTRPWFERELGLL